MVSVESGKLKLVTSAVTKDENCFYAALSSLNRKMIIVSARKSCHNASAVLSLNYTGYGTY